MRHLVLNISDTHFGKLTPGEYDLGVAEYRLTGLPERLASQISKTPDVINVNGIGDLAEGEDIFPTQNALVDGPAIDQVITCSGAIWKMLNGLHHYWPNAVVKWKAVPGNHGRYSKTANPRSNHDNTITYNLASWAHMSNLDWLEVDRSYDPITTVNLGGKRAVLVHKGPPHAVTNPRQGVVLRWLRRHKADMLICGHWHRASFQPFEDCFYICNGSLCGPDEYSDSLALHDPPRQTYFTVTDGKVSGFDWVEW